MNGEVDHTVVMRRNPTESLAVKRAQDRLRRLCLRPQFQERRFIGRKAKAVRLSFATPYQAVLLTNGSVYYGKLSGYGGGHPVLTDVYYILSKTDPETKQVTNVLVKRGKELHGPDRMYLNAGQIIFVEPVGPNSKVAQLINEANQ